MLSSERTLMESTPPTGNRWRKTAPKRRLSDRIRGASETPPPRRRRRETSRLAIGASHQGQRVPPMFRHRRVLFHVGMQFDWYRIESTEKKNIGKFFFPLQVLKTVLSFLVRVKMTSFSGIPKATNRFYCFFAGFH